MNNRQAGRRNRGRNNGRPNGGNRGGDNGNRIDNRARGNAPQLLEKYRNLARDAQLAGDRVNTEYYLQFADHYFRVIADNRSRQEEQQSRFRRNDEFDDTGDQGDSYDEAAAGNGADFYMPAERVMREEPAQSSTPEPAAEPVVLEEGQRRASRGRKPRQPRREENGVSEDAPQFDHSVLPPAIGRADNDSDIQDAATQEEAPAPRRRGRPRRATAEAAE